jgi:putative ABC transport system ATP-binding protein
VSNPHLAVKDISVSYGSGRARLRALNAVSLSLTPGCLTLVTGPSGSGKTTLLSVLGCLLSPESGDVWVMERLTTNLNEAEKTALRRQSIGFIFQAFRLFRSLSALENVSLALEVAGRRGAPSEALAASMLDEIGLSDKAHLKPVELSGGEKQRVAIARALVGGPSILLADEPTAALDSASGSQVMEILKRIAKKENRTVVVVSHDMRWLPLSDRSISLQDGRVTGNSELQ